MSEEFLKKPVQSLTDDEVLGLLTLISNDVKRRNSLKLGDKATTAKSGIVAVAEALFPDVKSQGSDQSK